MCVKLTAEKAVIKDIERNESRMVGGSDEAWMIVDSEVVLEPEDGQASLPLSLSLAQSQLSSD